MTLHSITLIAASENGRAEAIVNFIVGRKIIHGDEAAAEAALDFIAKFQAKDQPQPEVTK